MSERLLQLARVFYYIERKLGLPDGYFSKFDFGDDWSLIVRLHALIESSITGGLTIVYKGENCTTLINHLPLKGKNGKIGLAKKLGLITREHYIFIEKLSKLRNELVHDISNIKLTITDYFKDEALFEIMTDSIESSNLKTDHDLLVEKEFSDFELKKQIIMTTVFLIVYVFIKSININDE